MWLGGTEEWACAFGPDMHAFEALYASVCYWRCLIRSDGLVTTNLCLIRSDGLGTTSWKLWGVVGYYVYV